MGETLQINAKGGGRFAAWLATPDRPQAPGLVLVQYICGVNRMMREIADGFAREGFLTLAPDLFWRQQPGVQLNNDPSHPDPVEMALALKLNQGFDDETGLKDLKTCLDWLRAQATCSGRAGVLGYCLGGRLAYLSAARSNADASVGYYGVNIRKYLSEAKRIERPLMLHVAGDDEHCLADERHEIFAALEPNPNVELVLHDGAGHQFALPGSHRYDARAAARADRRSLEFLREQLRQAAHELRVRDVETGLSGMDEVACIVIGAGVVGLAIARALARQGRETIILEADASIGSQTSSRNNEVIHAGFLYPPGSLKAHLCRAGRDALYSYCDAHGVASKRIGKFVVATSDEETEALRSFAAYAAPNGVDDLEFIDGEAARAREPNLRCRAALFSPSTGVVDSHALMLALLGDAENAGAAIAYGSHVDWVKAYADAVVVGATSGRAQECELACGLLVNAAGLGAARIAGDALGRPAPKISFAKGSFFSLTGRPPFQRLIVPVGDTLALGGAFTIDIGGQGKFGPDLEWVDTVDYTVDPARLPRFLEAIRRYHPAISPDSLQPGYSGIRPRIAPGETPADWVVEGPLQHGARGVINLLGVDTPGLTACLSIADHVAALAQLMERDDASMPHC